MTSPDVVIVGGGVIGASVAYSLSGRGASVVLLDASTPGRATSASAGGLWPLGESLGLGCGVIFHAARGGGDLGPEPLPRAFMDFLCESGRRFPSLAAALLEATGIDVEAERATGLLYLIYGEEDGRHARRILDLLGRDAARAEEWTPDRVAERDPLVTRDLRGAIHFPGDHQVNPMLLAEALKRAAVSRGARFAPEARVRALRREGDRVTAVESTAGTFPCGAVVNAAGAWGGEIARLAGVSIPVEPVRGQIVCTETLRPGTLRTNLSTRDCYLLQKAHGEILIGSTTERCGFDVSVRFPDVRALARGAIRAVPALREATVKRMWAGLRPGTPDELPVLGPDGRVANLFHATGGFRTGIVGAPLTGEVVAASVAGEVPPISLEPYLAARFAAVAS